MARIPNSGTQHALRAGDYEAVIASVGATLRSLTHHGRDLVVPFDADEVRPAHRGATLAPWPNRVVDGTYTFGGVERQLALTEPARSHALHGLAAWLDFEAIDKGPDHVTLAAVIQPQTAYPWRIVVTTTFSLGPDGLTQSVSARNESDEPAPWGTGPHPYLVAGEGRVDDWTLELPAGQVLAVTPDRLIPTDLVAVDADEPERFDFRTARRIDGVEIDHAYSGLTRDDEGLATVRVTVADGTGVAMTWDAACPWVQVHTADKPDAAQSRLGLAVEPMTCAPDAFNAANYSFDAGLLVVEPGASTEASWRIAAIG
ncbi:aldose 1-epimerase family protein [Microbacterium sp. CFBP9034]|uniref:aldose 1-epimerase family protein n=1 Tax=Microbacterium sp. CFBP9034 TaxID=3096540 RepID=UPI002A6A8B47|nr:aldose 1-epimerase family protein [Microbacterium sp. CFBP9034]MDY0908627.1 aldose 1-epimerase family protein [Microbacterium sp. CFBP9034]